MTSQGTEKLHTVGDGAHRSCRYSTVTYGDAPTSGPSVNPESNSELLRR